MTATAEPRRAATGPAPVSTPALSLGAGVELLGPVHGSGYREGAALVRRGDGQMVHLGPLMYGLLECVDGRRGTPELAEALSERLGRHLDEEQVLRLAEKLSQQGLLAGTEEQAPPRRNPLLALRWKVLVTDPVLTRRLTAPFAVLFRPWIMWPVLAAFAGVFWFVLIHKGVASATAQAFHKPGLLLLVFALAVASAGFHELGHAAACRYGGATPGGMGMGVYLVWPAFYTDVTDTYRLPRRDRLRVDLGGLYFNAVVSVVTMGAWLVFRADALLLLVALQVLQMVKQLSPVIRADGYHILSDATGIPDLFSHIGPTMRRLLPGHRHEPTALTGRARALVTVWVLVVVPVLLSLSLGAVLLLPHLVTSAWDAGRQIGVAMPGVIDRGDVLGFLASIVRLVALALPVVGSALVTQKVARMAAVRARKWSAGNAGRQAVVGVVTAAVAAGLAWAWWPSGQYQPVRADQGGTLSGFVHLVSAPAAAARPMPAATLSAVQIAPGRHLAVAMIPVGGATKTHPALFVLSGSKGHPPVAIVSSTTPPPGSGVARTTPGQTGTTTGSATASSPPGSITTSTAGSSTTTTAPATTTPADTSAPPTATAPATTFPFTLPAPPGPHGTQALAENTTNGGVTYDVVYSLVTVTGGAPVDETNSAYAIAHCQACTTVAVSYQVVLIVGQSKDIAPINAAGALNYDCPACTTTALADQLVVTLRAQPSKALLDQLEAELSKLNALSALGRDGTPAAVAGEVQTVEQQIATTLNDSGLLAHPLDTSSPGASSTATSTSPGGSTATTSSSAPGSAAATSPTSTAPSSTTGEGTSTGQDPGSTRTVTAPSSATEPSSSTTQTSTGPDETTSTKATSTTTTSTVQTTTTPAGTSSGTATQTSTADAAMTATTGSATTTSATGGG